MKKKTLFIKMFIYFPSVKKKVKREIDVWVGTASARLHHAIYLQLHIIVILIGTFSNASLRENFIKNRFNRISREFIYGYFFHHFEAPESVLILLSFFHSPPEHTCSLPRNILLWLPLTEAVTNIFSAIYIEQFKTSFSTRVASCMLIGRSCDFCQILLTNIWEDFFVVV